MVGQRLQKYISSWGLDPGDVPKVITIFLGAKYVTLGAFVLVGTRFQPLRRVFPKRRTVTSAWSQVKSRLAAGAGRPQPTPEGGWYEWASDKYWQMSDKLQARLQTNRWWMSLAERTGQNPTRLVLGVAEGTLLCKLTYPFWGPFELWAILYTLKQRSIHAAHGSEGPDGDLMEQYTHAAAAAEDAQDLSPGPL
mmetsp:Transcript_56886/g.133467  ORF Transcript_56886/g.133467 Transcript_56886/m.133467 type:complete len:194 (-) Transcript_56886:29-610(-)